MTERITTRVGDLTVDEFGKDYDLILLSGICHMLDPEQNQDLFRRCYRALVPGGRIVIRDSILEPDKTAPRWAALFAINMRSFGDTYAEPTIRGWMSAAGIGEITRTDLDPDRWLIVGRKPG